MEHPHITYSATTVQSLHHDIGEEFCKQLGIDWKYTPSHSPHSNGSCERNHWTVDRKFEKYIRDTGAKEGLQRCLAMAIFAHNNTPKDSGFTPSQLGMGYAPKPPCFMQLNIDTIPVIPRTSHGCDSHNTRESILAIHETRTKQKGTSTVIKEKPLPTETPSGSERTTRGKNKPGGVKDDDVGKTVIAPLPDEFFSESKDNKFLDSLVLFLVHIRSS